MKRLYIYADESGAFDKVHNDIFVYGGILVLGVESRDIMLRKQLYLESESRKNELYCAADEIKACYLPFKKRRRYISMNCKDVVRFAVIINQKSLRDRVFSTKASKQRYLDYALKRGIKNALQTSFKNGIYDIDEIGSISIIVDEHSTATNGKYALRESIDEEFRYGIYNPEYNKEFPAIFDSTFPSIKLSYVDSAKVPLVRTADITANWVFCAERDFAQNADRLEHALNNIIVLRLP